MKISSKGMIATLGLVALMAGGSEAKSIKGKIDLATTPSDDDARGKASLVLKSSSDGKFNVRVKRLDGDADYDLLVGGVKVATIHTKPNGSGRARFSSRPRGDRAFLGFDPRAESIEVRSATGDDVLLGNFPPLNDDPTNLTCCIPDDSGPECEDRTQAECDAAGGVVVPASSCLPDPCGATPPEEIDTICCIPDDSGPQCEDRTQAECAAAGGTLVEATSCDPNPCGGTPPPPDADVQCCIPTYDIHECEDRTVEECALLGGLNKGPGACSPNPCGDLPPPPDHGICCLPNVAGDEIQCEDRDPTVCEASGGVVKTTESGVCEIDTCADVPPPTPDVMCCVPNTTSGELECEDLSEAACVSAGGLSQGPGICAPDTCGAPADPDIQCCEIHSNQLECRDRTDAECAINGGINVGDGACGPGSCDGL